MVLAQLTGNTGSLLATMWVYWVCTVIAFFRALSMRALLDRFDSIVTLPLFGILCGWLSAAAWVNTIAFLRVSAALPPSMTLTVSAALTIAAIGALSLLVLRRARGYFWFGATTLWALSGIASANIYDQPNRDIAMLSIGFALVVVAMLLWQRRPVHTSEFST